MSAPTAAFGRRPSHSIAVYSPKGIVPKILRDCLGEDVQMITVGPDDWGRTDIYVSPTGLSVKTERAAAAMGSMVVVLPEGTAWLHGQIANAPRPLWVFVATFQGDRPAPRFAPRSA